VTSGKPASLGTAAEKKQHDGLNHFSIE
jgi:hypothetical protein